MTNVHLIFIIHIGENEITEEIARQLITTGKNQIYFMTSIIKKGVPFSCISDYRKWNRYSFFRK